MNRRDRWRATILDQLNNYAKSQRLEQIGDVRQQHKQAARVLQKFAADDVVAWRGGRFVWIEEDQR